MSHKSTSEAATGNSTERGEPRFLFARIAVLLLAAMWFVSGSLKIMNSAEFQDTMELHRVIPVDYRGFGICLGPAEIQLGLFMIFALGSELRKTFGKLVLGYSLFLLIAFTVYLNMVDSQVLQESGCGCLGDNRIASGIGASEYWFAMIRNAVLIGINLVALFGPAYTMRRRAQRDARSSV